MKKKLIITIKRIGEKNYNLLSSIFFNKLSKKFEEDMMDGSVHVELLDWDRKKSRGEIIVTMQGTEEEIKRATKESLRDKILLKSAFRPFIEQRTEDIEE